MAYASTHSRSPVASLTARIADTVQGLRSAYSRARTYQRTYNELNALSTRELHDLGISRSMISRLAYDAAYGRDA